MRSIFALVGALLLLMVPVRAGHSPPKILMRIFVQTGMEGLPSTQAQKIVIPPDNESIMIRALPEVTEQDLSDVREDSSGYVHFQFDHRGQVDLDAVTAQNQGRILVVTLNGIVIYAPLIDEEISNGELVIPHPMAEPVVQLLQETARRNVKEEQKL